MSQNNVFELETIYLPQEKIQEKQYVISTEENIVDDNVLWIETRSIKLCFLCGVPSLFLLIIALVFISMITK